MAFHKPLTFYSEWTSPSVLKFSMPSFSPLKNITGAFPALIDEKTVGTNWAENLRWGGYGRTRRDHPAIRGIP